MSTISSGIAVILLFILLLLMRDIRAENKIKKEKRLIKDLNKKAFVDSMTSVRNKGAYTDFINALQKRIDKGEKMKFAVGIFDCNDLKKVNDENGHDKGDIYLKNSCQLICDIFKDSPVFRIGGDEFAVILQDKDFENMDELVNKFEERESEISAGAENNWEKVNVAYGFAEYDSEEDDLVSDTMRRADRRMYENKRLQKDGR